MLLAIDIGNTDIVAGIYKGERLVRHFRIETNIKNSKKFFTDFLKIDNGLSPHGSVPMKKIDGVAISSVVPFLNKKFDIITKKELNKKAFFINHKVNLGIKIEVDNPSEVGADRLVNSVAGKVIYGTPVIIIDFGTATTLDVISKEGNYIGGVIAPGIKLGAHALFTGTAKLPMVKLKKPKRFIGKNTIDCIRSGLIYGTIGSIEYFIKMIRDELKCKAKVIATGGLVNLIARKTNVIDYVNSFLTLEGLRIIYNLNRR